ncbi:hypothetical protein BC827DRAFT_732515 [Russula dissimulans]|nr:hypothetical protein BC827DRAFT_732515 [Russula dissimulans]
MENPILEDVQWIIVRLSTIMDPFTIAMYTGVSRHKVDQILTTFRRTGSVEVRQNTQVCKRRSLCDEDIMSILKRMHDIYLDELRADLELHCGRNVSRSRVWRMLRNAGFTMKKLSRIALERNTRHRAEYGTRIGSYTPEQLVFVDESSMHRRTN